MPSRLAPHTMQASLGEPAAAAAPAAPAAPAPESSMDAARRFSFILPLRIPRGGGDAAAAYRGSPREQACTAGAERRRFTYGSGLIPSLLAKPMAEPSDARWWSGPEDF